MNKRLEIIGMHNHLAERLFEKYKRIYSLRDSQVVYEAYIYLKELKKDG